MSVQYNLLIDERNDLDANLILSSSAHSSGSTPAPSLRHRFTPSHNLQFLSPTPPPPLSLHTDPPHCIQDILEHLSPSVPKIHTLFASAVRHVAQLPESTLLSEDQKLAIALYTLQADPVQQSLYWILNVSLATGADPTPFRSFLRLLLSALRLLPPCDGRVQAWCASGGHGGGAPALSKGQTVHWAHFVSLTLEGTLMRGMLRQEDLKVLFVVDSWSAVDISAFSARPGEREHLLVPPSRLRVRDVYAHADGPVTVVKLEEEPSKVDFLGEVERRAPGDWKVRLAQFESSLSASDGHAKCLQLAWAVSVPFAMASLFFGVLLALHPEPLGPPSNATGDLAACPPSLLPYLLSFGGGVLLLLYLQFLAVPKLRPVMVTFSCCVLLALWVWGIVLLAQSGGECQQRVVWAVQVAMVVGMLCICVIPCSFQCIPEDPTTDPEQPRGIEIKL